MRRAPHRYSSAITLSQDVFRAATGTSPTHAAGQPTLQSTPVGDNGEPVLLVDFCLRPKGKSGRPRTHVALKLADLPGAPRRRKIISFDVSQLHLHRDLEFLQIARR